MKMQIKDPRERAVGKGSHCPNPKAFDEGVLRSKRVTRGKVSRGTTDIGDRTTASA